MVLEQLDIQMGENGHDTNINLKWIKTLNIPARTITQVGETCEQGETEISWDTK